MLSPISPVGAPTSGSRTGAEGQQDQNANQRAGAAKGADAVAQASAAGTVDLARTAKVPAAEAATRADPPPPPRPAMQNLSLPVRADARSVMMAIASDRDPQIYGPEADMAANAAAAERARILSRAQAIVEAVMAQDTEIAAQDPYSAAKSGRHI
ncbi:hypothetical protein AB3Y40_13345 [Yoonia sp. R2331]|uniref:hypothetical protein n=1 Tax=Yoonia sp. R2331 TaxID=3237238 RepID=UPI0034E440B1